MCDINVFILKNGKEEMVMENVDEVITRGEDVRIVNLFGETKSLRARLLQFSNSLKKMVFESV